MNNGLETVIFDLIEMLGILFHRLMGYYKIKQDNMDLNQLIHYVDNLINL